MNVWTLERIRVFRTMRWVGILASFSVFGIAMPVVTRYQEALLRNVGGGVTIIAPEPTPPQAIAAYLQNAMQIGLIVAVLVSAGSLAFDARPEWSAFLRTRTRSLAALVVPKVVTHAAIVAGSFSAGLLAAWTTTRALIGEVPVSALVLGSVFGSVYLVFAVAVVAAAAGVARSVIGAGGVAIGVLVVLPLIGQLRVAEPWVPSALVGAVTSLAEGDPASAFVLPVVVAVAASVVLVWVACRLLERREV